MNNSFDNEEVTELSSDAARTSDRRSGKQWLVVSIVLFVLFLCCALLYYFQYTSLKSVNNKVKSLSSQNLSLNSENRKLTTKLSSSKAQILALQSQYDLLKSSLVAPTSSNAADQSALMFAVSSVQYVKPFDSDSPTSYLGVRLTMTNSTKSDIAMDPGLMKIMDSQSNIYNDFGFSGATNFPEGWGANTLQPQTIAAGKSVTGDLTFMMANDKLTSFTLVNLSKSYPINLDQK